MKVISFFLYKCLLKCVGGKGRKESFFFFFFPEKYFSKRTMRMTVQLQKNFFFTLKIRRHKQKSYQFISKDVLAVQKFNSGC